MDNRIQMWKNQLKYLPELLNNFDKMRDAFRFLHTCIGEPEERKIFDVMNYRNSTIYIIDIFLWVMADFGYTLQRNRLKDAGFACIKENMHKLYLARRDPEQEIQEIVKQKMSGKGLKYRENGNHLPYFMKDFHDQKNLFKFISDYIDSSEEDHILNTVNPYQAHVYTIDYFLFIMFRYGYSLQKSRMKFDFLSIDDELKKYKDEQNKKFTKMLVKE